MQEWTHDQCVGITLMYLQTNGAIPCPLDGSDIETTGLIAFHESFGHLTRFTCPTCLHSFAWMMKTMPDLDMRILRPGDTLDAELPSDVPEDLDECVTWLPETCQRILVEYWASSSGPRCPCDGEPLAALNIRGTNEPPFLVRLFCHKCRRGFAWLQDAGELPKIVIPTEPNQLAIDGAEPPIVFVSYSHDSQEHKQWVLGFAEQLRRNYIDVILDQWDLRLGMPMHQFMEQSIVSSAYTLMVCTPSYALKANQRTGGVGYETAIISPEIAEQHSTGRFICLLRDGTFGDAIPIYAKGRFHLDFRSDEEFDERAGELVRYIHGIRPEKPPLRFPPEAP